MRFSELDGARVGVWGAGREIASLAARLAARQPGTRIGVVVLDDSADGDAAARLGVPDAQVVGAGGAVAALAACDAVVRSPGVSAHRAELQAVRSAGVPVTTATSLWLAERGGEGVVAITGTNGKSTTASLTHRLLREAGREALLAGNIGVPALDLLDTDPEAIVVLELSSYQIADLEQGPELALVTNLYDEHLDWHGSFERYRSDKLRLLGLPGVKRCVLNARDERLGALRPAVETLWFGGAQGWDAPASGGISLRGARVLAAGELPLAGEHNALNLCAALTALDALGVQTPALPGALDGFEALAHRLQPVFERGGVRWIDDSISTTPQSALAALASFAEADVVLIAGGQDRGQDYGALARELARRCSQEGGAVTTIAIPTTGPRLREAALAAGVPSEHALDAPDLAAAVALAAARAHAGTVVLLSPAAPSFDSFRDFEQRGERFAELAREAAPSTDEGAAAR